MLSTLISRYPTRNHGNSLHGALFQQTLLIRRRVLHVAKTLLHVFTSRYTLLHVLYIFILICEMDLNIYDVIACHMLAREKKKDRC